MVEPGGQPIEKDIYCMILMICRIKKKKVKHRNRVEWQFPVAVMGERNGGRLVKGY